RDARRVRVPAPLGARQPAAQLRGVLAPRPAGHPRLRHARRMGDPAGARPGGRAADPPDRPHGPRGDRPPGPPPRRRSERGARPEEIRRRVAASERVLVTTLTKKMAEDLTDYLQEVGIRVRYIHSDIETIERVDIIRDLRKGEFDVLVGINLLREGLDLPE